MKETARELGLAESTVHNRAEVVREKLDARCLVRRC